MSTLIWGTKTAAPYTITRGTAATLGGYVYATALTGPTVTAQQLLRYNPVGNSWVTSLASVPTVQGQGALAAAGGKLYLFGGWDGSTPELSQNAYRYDPAVDSWTLLAVMPVRLFGHAAVTGADGLIYLLGGQNETGGSVSKLVYAYNPSTDTYTAKTSSPVDWGHNNEPAASLGPDGKIYVFGGVGGTQTTDTYCFDPVGNSWSAKAALPVALSEAGVAAGGDGLIYVYGGLNDSGVVQSATYAYNTTTNTFATSTALPAAAGSPVFASDGDLYAIGGFNSSFSPTNITYVGALNRPPNAGPITSPASGATLDSTVTQRVTWSFTDPDPGDSCSASDVALSDDGGTTFTVTNIPSPALHYDIVGSSLAAGDYQAKVRNYDSQGLVGPYGAVTSFTLQGPTDAPSITAPISGSTVDFTATVTWTTTSDQQAYQVRRVADDAGDPDTGTVYSDSGEVSDIATRSVVLSFDTNGRYEHIQVRVMASGEAWSDWADVRVLVTWIPPNPPVGTLLAYDQTQTGLTPNALYISWTTAAGSGDTPDAAYVDVYVSEDGGLSFERKATHQATFGAWRFLTPPSGVNVVAYLTSVAADGTSVASSWIDMATIGPAPVVEDDVPIISGGVP